MELHKSATISFCYSRAMRPVVVIGSSNTDLVMQVPELPAPGQTLMGSGFRQFHGGKGANQAVAARRAGSEVIFVGAFGNDRMGVAAIQALTDEGVDTHAVYTVSGTPSGVALIFVNEAGENCIGVAPGANNKLDEATITDAADEISSAGIVLAQLETPLATISHAMAIARAAGVITMLNPAPAAELPDALLANLDWITPNAGEAVLLTGCDAPAAAAAELLGRGVRNVAITLGADGAMLVNDDGCEVFEAATVDVVDTTGAGDTFNGVLAAALNEGLDSAAAIQLAVRAASLSVQRPGAIASIPRREEYA